MCIAIALNFLLIVDPKDVVRDDGRHIAIFKAPTIKGEISGVVSVLTDPKIIILLPAMFVGEMCLALTSSINAYYFNLRTRSLNNLLFQAIMIPAPICLAYIMDNKKIRSRRIKGLLGSVLVGLISLGAIGGLLGWVVSNHIDRTKAAPAIDWTDSAFAAGFILYVLSGIIYACFQIAVQWTLAALTNDPALCARYAGAFKGTVSFGMCISFTIDSQGMNFKKQTIVQLILYIIGWVCLLYVIAVYVKPTNYFLEDSVIVPAAFEQKVAVEGVIGSDQAEEQVIKEEIARGSLDHKAANVTQTATK
ncbi:hypothetical protein OHC33_010676 [Knufia fluminis]|uniref:Uncharacterized protein n=1 Tax=Knufia fluminis TaxID=191047 RepID=A0AAN8I170_9EURO|nr:hypothetical protein OHC33_010676 [Knufia fluminis]